MLFIVIPHINFQVWRYAKLAIAWFQEYNLPSHNSELDKIQSQFRMCVMVGYGWSGNSTLHIAADWDLHSLALLLFILGIFNISVGGELK